MKNKIAAFFIFVAGVFPYSGFSQESKLSPEDIVTPIHGNFLFACNSEELFIKLLRHAIRKENTKFNGMFNSNDCIQIPEKETYKILSVNPLTVEFTLADTNNSVGMWAAAGSFRLKK